MCQLLWVLQWIKMSDVQINGLTMAVLFMLLSQYFGATFSAHAH
jgi:hypothetical protein